VLDWREINDDFVYPTDSKGTALNRVTGGSPEVIFVLKPFGYRYLLL